jgi:hypothetical protein
MKNRRSNTFALSGLLLMASAPLFAADVGVIQEELILLPNDGAAGDQFSHVDISGTTAIVGAESDDDNGTDSGSAYLFDTTTGAQIAKLAPADLGIHDYFGRSVGISGDIAIVGAWYHDTDDGLDVGAAYLFDATTGQELFKLLATDGSSFNHFGSSVAISGDIAIVGAKSDGVNGIDSGSAYIFDVTTGAQLVKLLPTDGQAGDWFGWSVAISGDTAIVGAIHDDDNGVDSGSVYLFDTTTGAQLAKLLPSESTPGKSFGTNIAINSTTAIVGVPLDHENGSSTGTAYLFDIATGAQLTKLFATDAKFGDQFGSSVKMSETMAVIGAWQSDDSGDLSGSAYVYHLSTATELAKLTTSYENTTAFMGSSVSISETTVVAGAFGDDENGPASGSVFVFNLMSNPPGNPYCFGDGTSAACPCGNTGGLGEGCANSTGAGAKLAAVSTNSVGNNEFSLFTSGLPAGPGLYFQGDNKVHVVFGDGIRCVGVNVKRLEIRPSTGGISRTTVDIVAAGDVAAGDTKYYQLWYRDAVNSPCGSGFNLSNGYEVLWMP